MSSSTIIYLPHGGGPLPLLGGLGHEKMISFYKSLSEKLPRPDDILVISAHWEEDNLTILNSKNYQLLYDYYGFPEEAYKLTYPASGNTELVDTIKKNLQDINILEDGERGLDHGVFVPLSLIYPDADIPVTQISLFKSLDPKEHLELGKKLQFLNKRNVLIIGSGFSFHNLANFTLEEEVEDLSNNQFQDWLIETCTKIDDDEVMEKRLIDWISAPHASYCHPREEHLLPLHVCAGIAGRKGETIFDDYIVGKRAIAIKW